MNLLDDQTASHGQLRQVDGPFASAQTQVFSADAVEPPVFRVGLTRSLQLHRNLALGVALAGLLAAAAYFFWLWPIYTARSTVYVQPAPPRVMDNGSSMLRWPFDTNTYDSYIQQQIVSMTRPDVLANALHRLPAGSWLHKNESEQAAVERMSKAVEVVRMGTSYQVSIAARASTSVLAAQLANAVAAAYLEAASHDGKAGDAERLAMLREEKQRVQAALASDRAEQAELNKKLGVSSVSSTPPALVDEDLSRLHDQLVKARVASDAAAASLVAMDVGHPVASAALDAEADRIIIGDPGLISLKTTLSQRRGALVSQMSNLKPNHPAYKQDMAELAKIDADAEAMTKDLRAKASKRIEERLRTELKQTGEVEDKLNAQLGQMAGAAASITPRMQRANDLSTDILRLQNRYAAVEDQYHNVTMDDSVPSASFLAAAALPPLSPTKGGIFRNTLVIALAGLFLALGSAVAANKLDQRIYVASDVEQVLGFAPMAVLPDFHQVSDGVAEEHFLRLSAGIEYARQQGNLKSCIFTGTASGAGATTVATRVRSMLESMGRATVLVDASGNPQPHDGYYESVGHAGSSQLATQRASRSTAVLHEVAEESETAEESLVITDTAPLSISAETEYLARFVDAAIIVVESGQTSRAQLREAANTLQRLDVAAVGFVLNRVGLEKADPAFRRAIQAMEQHQRAQNGSFSRRTERSRPRQAAAEPAAAMEEKRREAAPAPQPQPEPLRQATVAAEHSPMPPTHELPAAPPEPKLLRRRATDIPYVGQSAQPEPIPAGSAAPRWFAQEHRNSAQQEMPGYVDARLPAKPQEAPPPVAVPPPPAPPPERVAAPPFHAEAPYHQPSASAASRLDAPWPVNEQQPLAPAPEPAADSPNDSATRMSGLKSLIYNLGQRNSSRMTIPGEELAEAVPPPPPVQDQRPAYAYPHTPYTSAPPRRDADSIQGHVIAQPEILPPRPLVETTDDRHVKNVSASRKDRRDAYDDVEILPSWRGQYRKKK